MNINRTIDRVKEWWRYPQPNWLQRKLLGLHTDSFDTEQQARLLASQDSANYLVENLLGAQNFATDYDLHEAVPNWVDDKLAGNGLLLEFGVATGRTLRHFGRLFPERTVYGFDGFEGLPEDWDWRHKSGHFAQQLPRTRENCELVVGWFDNTLPTWLPEHKENIALLHLDADLYSSTVTVLDNVAKQIVAGTIVVFDEYLNYPGWRQHEYRAWQEFVKKHKVQYEYLGFVSRHQQVAVRVLNKGA